MARPSVDDEVHRKMIRFAANHDMSIRQAYKFLVNTFVDEDGHPKEDFTPLADILRDFKRFIG